MDPPTIKSKNEVFNDADDKNHFDEKILTNLANVWHQNVNGFGVVGIILTSLHVKCFDVGRKPMEHNGLADGVGHKPFGSLWYVFTNLVKSSVLFLVSVFFQPINGLNVLHSAKWFPSREIYC